MRRRGKSFSARSAEQFGAGVSGSHSPMESFKGLREDSQRTAGKTFLSPVRWGGSPCSQQISPSGLSNQSQLSGGLGPARASFEEAIAT